MTAPSDAEAEAYIRSRINRLPPRLRRAVHWLRRPEARAVRLPAALLFLAGGVLWFLPLVGAWMLPLGIVLLAEDIPPLKRRTAGLLMCLEARWTGRRGKRPE